MLGKLTPSQPFTSAVKDACLQSLSSLSSSSLSSSSTSSSLSLSLLSLMLLLLFRSCSGIVLCVCFLLLMVFLFAYFSEVYSIVVGCCWQFIEFIPIDLGK